jgi:hypothetical protein
VDLAFRNPADNFDLGLTHVTILVPMALTLTSSHETREGPCGREAPAGVGTDAFAPPNRTSARFPIAAWLCPFRVTSRFWKSWRGDVR